MLHSGNFSKSIRLLLFFFGRFEKTSFIEEKLLLSNKFVFSIFSLHAEHSVLNNNTYTIKINKNINNPFIINILEKNKLNYYTYYFFYLYTF